MRFGPNPFDAKRKRLSAQLHEYSLVGTNDELNDDVDTESIVEIPEGVKGVEDVPCRTQIVIVLLLIGVILAVIVGGIVLIRRR
jgi:hypothetical protein